MIGAGSRPISLWIPAAIPLSILSASSTTSAAAPSAAKTVAKRDGTE